MNVKKIVGWTVVIFIAYYLFTDPTGAAAVMKNLFHVLHVAANSVATFLKSL
jgi:hypothetical protein